MAAGAYTSDPKAHHITDLVQLGFYFCLRPCEYTKCTGHRQKVQFRTLLDLMFFTGDSIIPTGTPIEHFHQANQIVLILDNQKNPSEVKPSLTSNQTQRQPALSERASTSSFACKSKSTTPSPLSVSLPPLKGSTQLALQI